MAVRLILYGLLAWVVVSVPVALLFGRLCSLRDGWPSPCDQEMAAAGATAERDGTRFERALHGYADADRRPSADGVRAEPLVGSVCDFGARVAG